MEKNNNFEYFIQDIDACLSIIKYVKHEKSINDCDSLNGLTDFICVWNYNAINDLTLYTLKPCNPKKNMAKIASILNGFEKLNITHDIEIFGRSNENICEFTCNGIFKPLPFECINDFDLLIIFGKSVNGTFIKYGKKQTYVLFTVEQIKKEWLQEKIIKFIKKKYSEMEYIVFETDSGFFNNNTQMIKEFYIFYNQNACKEAEKLLALNACFKTDYVLTFKSEKNFPEVLLENKKLNNDINEMDSFTSEEEDSFDIFNDE
jgi:hypothetical protein